MNATQQIKVMNMEENSFKLWATIVTAGAGAIIALDKFCEFMRPKIGKITMRRAVLKYFQDCRYVQEQMDSMRTPAVNRVLFFSASNGGGIPKAGSKMSTSTILWSLSESAQSKFPVGGYQNTPLDGHYIGLLERLMAKEKMHVDPATIEIETQIGSIYHAEKVKDSYWFYLGVKGNSFLYMSVSSTEFKFEPDTITQMDVAVNNIRARLK